MRTLLISTANSFFRPFSPVIFLFFYALVSLSVCHIIHGYRVEWYPCDIEIVFFGVEKLVQNLIRNLIISFVNPKLQTQYLFCVFIVSDVRKLPPLPR